MVSARTPGSLLCFAWGHRGHGGRGGAPGRPAPRAAPPCLSFPPSRTVESRKFPVRGAGGGRMPGGQDAGGAPAPL